jgi:hypothetical protein
MSSSIVWRIYVRFRVDIDIKILEVGPLEVGHAFPRLLKGGYLFLPRLSSLYDAIHG